MSLKVAFVITFSALGSVTGLLIWMHYRLKLALYDVQHFKQVAKLHEADAEFWKGHAARWKAIAETALGSNPMPTRWAALLDKPKEPN